MLQYWTGPATVVAYVTDEEILLLFKKLQRSVAVQKRKNVAYHVVYKRHVSTHLVPAFLEKIAVEILFLD